MLLFIDLPTYLNHAPTHKIPHTHQMLAQRISTSQDNTIPPWVLNCACTTQKYTCLARLKQNIMYIKEIAFEQCGSLNPRT